MNNADRHISEILVSGRWTWLRHSVLIACILLITSSVLWDAPSGEGIGLSRLGVWAGYAAAMTAMVYANVYLLAKPLLLRNRPSSYLAWAGGLVFIFILTVGILQDLLPDGSTAGSIPAAIGVVSSVAAVSLLFAGTSAIVILRQWMVFTGRRQELETANLQAELQALKNQINPHFLFNMLNNSYLLIKKRRPEAQEVLFRLEDLLRYQINDSRSEDVTLGSEVRFLNDFLALEQIRRDEFRYSITDGAGDREVRLSPMLFIPFVENAVKHNTDGQGPSYVEITFSRWKKGVIFVCRNSVPAAGGPERTQGGIGLRNIRRRLELLYPGRHELTVEHNPGEYSVTLKLEI